jgi:predicted glycoside hydrolase/deacetylase ChbG (UPF0249 family)
MRIILNADDFGASPDINGAIIECLESGLVSSTSIMVGAASSEEAIGFAQRHPQYAYGVHLQFVGDGTERPISDPALVSDLVGPDGCFLSTNTIRLRALLNRINVSQIELEMRNQIERIREKGISVSHVDSHRHVHKFPLFRRAMANLLPKLQIDSVRNVQDMHIRRPVEHPTYWLGIPWRRGLMRSFVTTDHFYMPTTAHDPEWYRLAERLPRSDASLEVGVHPGRADEWRRQELESLEPFVEAASRSGHTFTDWDRI